ncbi:response regulator [Pseudodesulfovibrio sp. F-1]|uniref:Response regulator n=1 Tax=Pseudodesulfovibrio alkaliphilus TaxID=2661613 RepID=A0A7K1KLJ9_9BACT|nr:response regulator transcription factor [Pseudodesulfovibrio alkaliphilus]MUM76772.1 response regulator [Pseudodesulfovibrio alkaliphilus]
MKKVLLIDDDIELAEMLSAYLAGEGFTVDAALDGDSGLRQAMAEPYCLILLDIMLPDTSGFNVLSRLRTECSLPVIMLTGRGEEIDRVVGLEMGADDYVSKPFPLRELLARMRAVLRRWAGGRLDAPGQKTRPMTDIRVGGVVVNRGAQQVTLDDAPVHLTATEFGLIELLALRPGTIVQREELMEKVLGRDADLDDYVLNVHMSNLRRKLGTHASIKTIRGRGYLLATPGIGAA